MKKFYFAALVLSLFAASQGSASADIIVPGDSFPTAIDQCKQYGWVLYVDSVTGLELFKNQGDCVSYVTTSGANEPAGPAVTATP